MALPSLETCLKNLQSLKRAYRFVTSLYIDLEGSLGDLRPQVVEEVLHFVDL